MATLWIGSEAGWPLKGLGLASPNYQVGAHFEALLKGMGLASPDYQVGAHFEALDKGVLVAASKSNETFFCHFNFP